MKFWIFITLVATSAALRLNVKSQDVNLNELCNGLLFNAIAHPYDNNLFIGCVQGRGTVFGCDNENHVFDVNSVQCVDPNLITTTEVPTDEPTTDDGTTLSNVDITTTTEIDTDPTTTTTERIYTTTRIDNININFVCPLTRDEKIPHRTDCTRYIECIRGIGFPRTCEVQGHHFDVITKECQPADVALCADIIRCG